MIGIRETVVDSYISLPKISNCGGTKLTLVVKVCVRTTGSKVLPADFGGLIAVPAIIACIILEILFNTAIVYVLSRASAAIGPAALIVVPRSSAPSTTVRAGTMIGVISSNSPTLTLIVVVPENPSSTCSHAYRMVLQDRNWLVPRSGSASSSTPSRLTYRTLAMSPQ